MNESTQKYVVILKVMYLSYKTKYRNPQFNPIERSKYRYFCSQSPSFLKTYIINMIDFEDKGRPGAFVRYLNKIAMPVTTNPRQQFLNCINQWSHNDLCVFLVKEKINIFSHEITNPNQQFSKLQTNSFITHMFKPEENGSNIIKARQAFFRNFETHQVSENFDNHQILGENFRLQDLTPEQPLNICDSLLKSPGSQATKAHEPFLSPLTFRADVTCVGQETTNDKNGKNTSEDNNDVNISDDNDVNISDDNDVNISDDNDVNTSEDSDVNTSEDNDVNISEHNDVNITEDNDVNISGDNDVNISGDNDTTEKNNDGIENGDNINDGIEKNMLSSICVVDDASGWNVPEIVDIVEIVNEDVKMSTINTENTVSQSNCALM